MIRPLRKRRREVGRAFFIAAFALCLASGLLAVKAHAVEVPADRQVLILTRALAYDGNLKARAGSEIVVGVLAKGGSSVSEQAAEAVMQAFKALGAVKVQGLPLKIVALSYTAPAALGGAIKQQSVDALYICAGLDGELPAILEVSKVQKVISMGSREEHVMKGASLGVFAVDSKPTIFVNLPSSKNEGAAFGSDLLRLARVIK